MDVKQVLERIRKLRELKEIKQSDIAKQLNLSSSAYGKLERGETELTLTKLERIADILGFTISSLLNGDANYILENGNHSITTNNNSFKGTKEIVEQLIVSKNKEVVAKMK